MAGQKERGRFKVQKWGECSSLTPAGSGPHDHAVDHLLDSLLRISAPRMAPA